MKAKFITLGCKVNQYETEIMKEQLLGAGIELTADNPNITLINTCCVTGRAEQKSRQAVRRALKSGSRVIVTGCQAELFPHNFMTDERIELILSNQEKYNLLPKLDLPPGLSSGRVKVKPRVRANLMIQNGCNDFCTYCIVPFARGRVKSKPLPSVVEEASRLINQGVREIVLTGINLATYGQDLGNSLSDVLKELSSLPELLRLRVSSLEPMHLSRRLLDEIAALPKVCPYLHLPLQSGDDRILQKMKRNYSVKDYRELVDYARKVIPGLSLGTDILVGFPSEAEVEFVNTCRAVEEIGFSRIHVFPYSVRKFTAAASLPEQLSPPVIEERRQKMLALRNRLMYTFHQKYTEQTVPVLVEQRDKKSGQLEGLTDSYIRIFFPGADSLLGKIVPVKVKSATTEHLLGFLA